MPPPLPTTLTKTIYYAHAAIFVLFAALTKLFFVDEDMGAHFKDFNKQLFMSDILLLGAIFFGLLGGLLNWIQKSPHATLTNKTIFFTGLLVSPFVLFFALTPLLSTIWPGEVGENTATFLGFFVGLGLMIWAMWVPIIVLGQLIRILIYSIKK